VKPSAQTVNASATVPLPYVNIALGAATGVDVAKIQAIEAVTKTIIAVNVIHPWLLGEIEPDAAAILTTFDTDGAALLDVLTGDFKPIGKLPMAFPKDQDAVDRNAPDTPGHLESFDYAYRDAGGNAYTFGFGLNYQ
jgi:beta-glucosidase